MLTLFYDRLLCSFIKNLSKIQIFIYNNYFLILDFGSSLVRYISNLIMYNASLSSFIEIQTCVFWFENFYEYFIEIYYVVVAYKLPINL